MGNTIIPGVETGDFLQRALVDGYSMQTPLIDPDVGASVSDELAAAGLLVDKKEMVPTSEFESRGMRVADLLHGGLNRVLSEIEGSSDDHLPYFSVRVFEPGVRGTDIHRNDRIIGPWAIGVTLRGQAPFNVYTHDKLSGQKTLPLRSNGTDPAPIETMDASAGSAWALYTGNEQLPHSSGIVKSETQRVLLI